MDLGTLVTTFGADTKPLDSAVSHAKRKFEEVQSKGTTAFATIKKSIFSLKGAFAAVGIGVVVSKMISATKDYETALVDMGKVTGQSFSKINKQIGAISPALGSSTELMRGYYQTISAGVTKPVKALGLLTTASKLAKVAHIDQATSVKTLAVMMGSYKGQLKSTTDAANLLLSIERYGITTTGEMASQIGLVANLAHQAGLSASELGAALAQITKSGIGTAESVTQLRSLLTALMRNFDKLPDSIRKYGSLTVAIKKIGFINVLRGIMQATKGNESELTKLLGRQESYLAMLQLLKGNGREYGEVLKGMNNRTGALDKAWKNWKHSLEGIWSTLKNKLINILIKLGYKLLPVIKAVLSGIIKILPTLISLIGGTWKVLAAVPVGVIQFFKNLSKSEIESAKNANKVGAAIKNIKPPKPTFWQQFWMQTKILASNIGHVLEFVFKAIGDFLGLLVQDVIDTAHIIGKEWTTTGMLMKDALTLHPKWAKEDFKRLISNAGDFIGRLKVSGSAFLTGISQDWKNLLNETYNSTFAKKTVKSPIITSGNSGIAEAVNTGIANNTTANELNNIKKKLSDERKAEVANAIKTANDLAGVKKRLYYERIKDEEREKAREIEIDREKTAKELQIVKDRISAAENLTEEMKTPLENYNDKLKKITTLKPYLSTETFTRAMHKLQIEAQGGFDAMRNIMSGAARAASDSMSNLFFDVMTGKLNKLKDVFLSFSNSIMRIMSQVLAKETLIGGAKMLGAPVGGTILRILGAKEGGIFSQGFVPIRAFANGGIVSQPTLGLIGEGKGPEAVIPLKNGYVPVKMNEDKKEKSTEIHITNVVDPALFGDYLASPQGENMILNVIARNNYKIRRSLG